MTSTYTTRAAELRQEAYRRRVAAFGLGALLAPYALRRVTVPAQRRRVLRSEVRA